MAVNDTKRFQWGQGLVFNITSDICLGVLSKSWKLIPEPESLKIPLAACRGDKTVLSKINFRVEAIFHEMTPEWFADLFGGTIATGGLLYRKETLTRSGNTFTMTPPAGGTQAIVGEPLIRDIVNNTFRTVAVATAEDVSFTRSGLVLTCHADDDAQSIEVMYIYSDTGTASGKIIVPTQTLPGVVRLVLPWALQNPDTGTIVYHTFDCQKCVPTKLPEFGGDVQTLHEFAVGFDVNVEADGDLVYYPNGYNPTY